MQLVLTGKNFVVTDRIREYVERKVNKLDRYLPSIDEARIEISQEKTKSAKDRNVVQLTLRANGAILRAEDRSEAIYACIDNVVDKIHRQIVRYKGKRVDRQQGQLGNKQNQNSDQEAIPVLEPEIVTALAEEEERKIVRTKQFLVSPMTAEEAIEQMELLGHNFFIFYNTSVERINVLYQRGDNNYGLLDPELA